MSGWTVRLKNWSAPLYVRCEAPPRHISWTGNRDEAKHFRRRRDAERFMEAFGERIDQCEFSVDRRAPQHSGVHDESR